MFPELVGETPGQHLVTGNHAAMVENSGIAWTDDTFNPWWGCVKVSPACANCYAAAFSKRTGNQVWGPNARRRFFGAKHWAEPLKWNAAAEKAGIRRRVFCASMADVLEQLADDHPDREQMRAERTRLLRLIDQTPWLVWLLLTKRPQNAPAFGYFIDGWPKNVWFGTTVEDQQNAEERIPKLLEHSAAVRFLSVEPMLGPVNLDAWNSRQLHWVIIGSESIGARNGRLSLGGAYSTPAEWNEMAADLVCACRDAGIPVFVKQIPGADGRVLHEIDQFPKSLQIREFPISDFL
jgi:protein gp37